EPRSQLFRYFVLAKSAVLVLIEPVKEPFDSIRWIYRRPGTGIRLPLLGVGCGACYEQGREKREKCSVLHESASIYVH
ncbi:MAG: hypothetical protein VB855_18695, partial [Pirellulaceae bacterium]